MIPNLNIPSGAVVIDASVAIAISAKEIGREPLASLELQHYSTAGYAFYAPGAIVAETLYILCGKLQDGRLSAVHHNQAVLDFQKLLAHIQPPHSGEASLVERAEAMRMGYGCSRSADGIYIALAEQLMLLMPTIVLTFDRDMEKQAARHAPSVRVQVI